MPSSLAAASSDVPIWAAALLAFGGGIIGTLLSLGHERGAEMRTRMLQTADDHLSGVAEFGYAARELRLGLTADQRPDDEELDRRLARVQEGRDRLLSTLIRIQLLFGIRSATWRTAVALDRWTDDVLDYFREWRGDPTGTQPAARPGPDIEAFSRAARRDVRFGSAARILEQLRDWSVLAAGLVRRR